MGDRLRAGIPSRYVTSQLGQLSLASLRGRLIEYQHRLTGQRTHGSTYRALKVTPEVAASGAESAVYDWLVVDETSS